MKLWPTENQSLMALIYSVNSLNLPLKKTHPLFVGCASKANYHNLGSIAGSGGRG